MNEAFERQKFKKGQSGNPQGRPQDGAHAFLVLLKKRMALEGEVIIKNAFKEGKKRPIAFLRDVLLQVITKEMLMEVTGEDGKPKEVHTGTRAVVEVGFHSLRHTFVSLCRAAGAPLSVVEAIVGHASPAMTR